MLRTKFVLSIAGAVAALVGTPAAAQQFTAIPCDTVTSQQLDAGQEDTVRAFVDEWTTRLESEDIRESMEARDMLLRPFRECDDVSVAFRVAMGRTLQDRLSSYVRSDDDRLAFDACQIAGRVASSETLRALADGLRDDRASVRAGAAAGYREILESVAMGNNAVGQAAVGRAMTGLLDALRNERNPVVAEILIHAFGGTSQNPSMHVESMAKLSEGLHDLAKTVRLQDDVADAAAWDHAFLAGADAAYQSMLRLQIAQAPPGEFGTWAGRMSGQFYAYARGRLEAEGGESLQGTSDGKTLATLVEAADSLLQISHTWITPGSREVPDKAAAAWRDAVSRDKPGLYVAALEPIIGVSGRLTKAPYSANASEFR
ncbi:MAG: hypothetical protein KDA21_02095 [Phycisphaerales bacterium]|nr:hypothetical protein [Phycisphaerales bacterium]